MLERVRLLNERTNYAVICINLRYLLVCSGDHTGVAPTNIRFIHNLFINSKLGLIIPPHLTVLSYRCIINKVNFIFKEMTVYELKNKRDFICDNGGVRLFDDVGLCASRRRPARISKGVLSECCCTYIRDGDYAQTQNRVCSR